MPEEKIKIVVNQWEIVKKKVKVLEERLFEVPAKEEKKDGKLCELLLWLHEAEALLGCYATEEGCDAAVPCKFLLRQHEVCAFV